MVDQGERGLAVWGEVGGRWWRVVLAKSQAGYLYVRTFHPSSGDRLKAALEKFPLVRGPKD